MPHALFALDAGAVRDEFQVIRDGVKRDFDGWNQDQTLRSSMRHSRRYGCISSLPVRSVRCAKRVSDSDSVWQRRPVRRCRSLLPDGALRIAAMEQVDFLRKLYRNELPFKVEHQRLVKIS